MVPSRNDNNITNSNTRQHSKRNTMGCLSSYGIEVAGNDSDEEQKAVHRAETQRRKGYENVGSPTVGNTEELRAFPDPQNDLNGGTATVNMRANGPPPREPEDDDFSDWVADDDEEDDPFIMLDRADIDVSANKGGRSDAQARKDIESDLSIPSIDGMPWSDFLHRLCEALRGDRSAIRNSPASFDELRAIQILMSNDNFMIALHQPRVRGGETSGYDDQALTALEAAEEMNQEGGIFRTSVLHHQTAQKQRQEAARDEALARMMSNTPATSSQRLANESTLSATITRDDATTNSGNASFANAPKLGLSADRHPTAPTSPNNVGEYNGRSAAATANPSSAEAVIVIDPPIIRRGALRYCDDNILRFLVSCLLKDCHATPSSSSPTDEQHQLMKERLIGLAVLCAAAYPFIIAVFTTRLLVKNIVEFRSRSQELVATREWTPTAEWTFRLYNEVPHLAEARLRRGASIARSIIDASCPPRPIYRAIQRLASTVILLIVFITFINASMLTIGVAFDRTLLWWLSSAIVLYSAFTQPTRDREYSHLPDLRSFVKVIEYCNPVWLSSPSAFSDDVTDIYLPPRLANVLSNFIKIIALPATLFYLWFVSDSEGSEISVLVRFVRDNSLWVEGVGAVARTSDFAGRWNEGKMSYQTGWGPMIEATMLSRAEELGSLVGENMFDSAPQVSGDKTFLAASSAARNDPHLASKVGTESSVTTAPPPTLLATIVHHFSHILHPKVPTEVEKRRQQLAADFGTTQRQQQSTAQMPSSSGGRPPTSAGATTFINMGGAFRSSWQFGHDREGDSRIVSPTYPNVSDPANFGNYNKRSVFPTSPTAISAIKGIMGEHAAVTLLNQQILAAEAADALQFPSPLITVTHEHTKSLKSLSYFAHCYDRWSLTEIDLPIINGKAIPSNNSNSNATTNSTKALVERPSLGLTVRALLLLSDSQQPSALTDWVKEEGLIDVLPPTVKHTAEPPAPTVGSAVAQTQQSSDPSTKYSTPTASTSTAKPPTATTRNALIAETTPTETSNFEAQAAATGVTTPRPALKADDVLFAGGNVPRNRPTTKAAGAIKPGTTVPPLPLSSQKAAAKVDPHHHAYLLTPRQAMDTPRRGSEEGEAIPGVREKTAEGENEDRNAPPPSGGFASNITAAQPHMNLFASQE